MPEKEIVVYDGACPVHDVLRSPSLERVQRQRPEAVVIAHPECRDDVLAMADEICSTTAMISAVGRHPSARTFIVATEHGILNQMKLRYPDKGFVIADGCLGCRMHCPYMKMIDLVTVRNALLRGKHEIAAPPDVPAAARRAPARQAAATSVTSARVGRECSIMLSSIWVATMTGLRARMQASISLSWMSGTFLAGSSTPRSPRAIMIPSVAARMSGKFSRASGFSILATMAMSALWRSRRRLRSRTSCARRTKERAM